MKHRQAGFSLVEMLTVLAIIGVLALVTVPNFMSLRRSNMIKSSMRNLVNDIRGARQRAVTRHESTKIVFTNGSSTTGRQYTIWEQTSPTAAWTQVGGAKSFEQMCYVSTEQYIPTPDTGTTYELKFRSDGTAVLTAGQFKGTVNVKTDAPIPHNEYQITVQYSGSVQALPYP